MTENVKYKGLSNEIMLSDQKFTVFKISYNS